MRVSTANRTTKVKKVIRVDRVITVLTYHHYREHPSESTDCKQWLLLVIDPVN